MFYLVTLLSFLHNLSEEHERMITHLINCLTFLLNVDTLLKLIN